MSQKHPFDLAKWIFGPKDVNIILKGLGKIKSLIDSFRTTKGAPLLALPAPGLPAPQETPTLPAGPGTALTVLNNQLEEFKDKKDEAFDSSTSRNFFADMLNNA